MIIGKHFQSFSSKSGATSSEQTRLGVIVSPGLLTLTTYAIS